MARPVTRQRTHAAALPEWVAPQLTQLVDSAPEVPAWLHEIKYDGYRMHARLDCGRVKLLTRTGLDWTHKYPAIAKAAAALDARQTYLDGELCGMGPDGITSFSIVQLASDNGNAAALVFFLFDLLHLDGEDFRVRPLIERKDRLAALLANAPSPLHYSDHQLGHGRAPSCRTAKRPSGYAPVVKDDRRAAVPGVRQDPDGGAWRDRREQAAGRGTGVRARAAGVVSGEP